MDETGRLVERFVPAADLQALLCEWQATASHEALERLISMAAPVVAVVVCRVLGRRGIRDPGAIDDAIALVFNHLRRLPGVAQGEPAVALFDPGRGTAADHGRAYLQKLAHDRALDVARRRRREGRRMSTFSSLDDATHAALPERIVDADDEREEGPEAPSAFPHEALAGLEPREQTLVQLLLEGKSQVVIAHVLGVCEGTVSRLRARVIAKLQAAIRTRSSVGREETPAPPARAARPGRARASRRRGPPGPSAPA